MLTQSLHRLSSILLITAATALPLSATPENLMAAVKFPPPKTLTDKVMTIARVIQPGQQTEMLPLIFLGSFGYPNYPGISETEAVTLFIFDADAAAFGTPPPMVLMAQIAKDNPLRQLLPSFEIYAQDRGDWLLLSKDPAAFEQITDFDALVAIARKKAEFDIEARIFLGKDKVSLWTNNLKEIVTERHSAATGGDHQPIDVNKKLRFIDLAAASLENLEWTEIGINLTPDAIELGKLVQATPGTPEATLFSSPAGGNVPAAAFLKPGDTLDYYGKLNYPALHAYYEVIAQRAEGMVGPKGKEWLAKADEIIEISLKQGDGSTAGSMSSSGLKSNNTSLAGGSYTDESLTKILDISYNELTPQVMAALSQTQYAIDAISIDYTPNTTSHEGVAIHEVTIVTDMGDDLEDLPPAFAELQSQSFYYAVISGYMVQTSTLGEMETLIAAAKAGKPLPDSIAATLPLVPGAALQYQYDIISQVAGSFEAMAEFMPEGSPMIATITQLKQANLKPATGAVTHSNNRLKATIAFPVETVARAVQAMQAMQAAMMQEFDDDTL